MDEVGKLDEPLFETKVAKGRAVHRVYVVSVFVGICFIIFYRVSHLPPPGEAVARWSWIGLFIAELWFSLYWILNQFCRWNPVHRYTFKNTLSLRYGEELPKVDIFVCTADPRIEPPLMVVNTVLSMMAYDYSPEKLTVYLSDDGGSDLTFYALLLASDFSRHWLPFCNKFGVEPRSPHAYFSTTNEPPSYGDPSVAAEWLSVKKLYETMVDQIEKTARLGHIQEDVQKEHKGFSEWNSVSRRNDHQAIIQILIDGRFEVGPTDTAGKPLPTLVYVAREKRPHYRHNFKAGAMNALIRVSSKISNGSIILNVDCDMYSNNSESVRDALCFFMDEENCHDVAFVQYPQCYDNITTNDLYASSLRVITKVELPGLDFNGGPCYIGTGCFHRRDALCGAIYNKEFKTITRKIENDGKSSISSASELQETCKLQASCTYEQNTLWGKEMGLIYGCPVEDIVTGLTIQCRGWRSIYFYPKRPGFLGIAPTTLLQTLIQYKRWSEGHCMIVFSKYCPIIYGYKKIPLKLQFSYLPYNCWALNSLPTLYYAIIPSLCLLRHTTLFPEVWSLWMLPFAYVFVVEKGYSLWEFFTSGGTFWGWRNMQRMQLFLRTSSFFFGFLDGLLKQLGFSNSGFVITAKVVEEDVTRRYMKEVIEFGADSPMFTILGTVAMLNLFSFSWGLKRLVLDFQDGFLEPFTLQLALSGMLIFINLAVYQGLFFRKDKGKLPAVVALKSVALAALACSVAFY